MNNPSDITRDPKRSQIAKSPTKEILKKILYSPSPRLAQKVLRPMWLKHQMRALRKSCAHATTVPEFVNAVLASSSFRPNQKRQEAVDLFSLVADLKPRRLCEIGGLCGGTLFLATRSAVPSAQLLSIDLGYAPAQVQTLPLFAQPGQKVTCWAADSHAPETERRVAEWLAGDMLDFLFIDGDHSYAGVEADFNMYSKFVRPGGIIAFHDIVADYRNRPGVVTLNDSGEVPQFWKALKKNRRVREYVDDPEQDGFGIGVIHWETGTM